MAFRGGLPLREQSLKLLRLGVVCALLIIGQVARSREQNGYMLPIAYQKYFRNYSINLCYIPIADHPSEVDVSTAAACVDGERGPGLGIDNKEIIPAQSRANVPEQTDMQRAKVQLNFTESDLVEIMTQPKSKWYTYHLGNVYINDRPLIRLWLQNSQGVALLAHDRRSKLVFRKMDGDESNVLELQYTIRIPEADVEQNIIFKLNAKTGEIIDDTDIDRCHHAKPEMYGEYRVDTCSGDSYKCLTEMKRVNTFNQTLHVIEHFLLSPHQESRRHILYSVLYDTRNKAVIAMKTYVEYTDGFYLVNGVDHVLFDKPIAISNAASVSLGSNNEWQAPTLHPKHSGNVTVDGEDVYSVDIMPFGTMSRPSNALNAVYYLLNGIKRTLVIPKLQSRSGVNLLSEDASSYVVANIENENNQISVVYKLNIPGCAAPEAVVVRFEATQTCINLKAPDQTNLMELASVPICKSDIPLGCDAQCVVYQIQMQSKSKENAVLYTFIYDAKVRHLTAVMHRISLSKDEKINNAITEEVFYKSASYTAKVNIDINRNGFVKVSQIYAGYVSKGVYGQNIRAIVLPDGIKNFGKYYTNRFLYRGTKLVEIYMESENGVSLVNRASPPVVTKEANGGIDIVHITYSLKLLEYNTPHKVTLDFECKQVMAQSGGKKTEITLSNKYQRYRMDIDTCVIDASVWTEDTESFGGKCTVGMGEEGLYIVMSRIIKNKDDPTTGHFYKFLYETQHAIFFCKSVPIRAVEQKPNKSCRWIRAGDDRSYTYSLGGSKLIEQDISTM
ncbi:hypothetical protein, conserved [Babesia bigemina]|uniref:Uncharacterized protein n=1 Tax=Babesia bigemina TaxID=5866 RepID=A0A061DB08_BABBI|nr:hypothetical protein, conserved [Babesia bigemina]CDR96104.1 hypothetical protein, conserved [Babesia bigemina]|eukprot:XP_012768290.1 hypothetical protein, conserved [Babesia bigemina]